MPRICKTFARLQLAVLDGVANCVLGLFSAMGTFLVVGPQVHKIC